MDLSIIIVNWNAVDYLKACLTSLYRTIHGLDCEVIVLDNASRDHSVQMVKDEFPQVILIERSDNLGFTRGNNFAYQYASGNTILLLNPDTEVGEESVASMFRHLCALPQAGAIGCRLLNSDGSLQTTCVQAFPSLLNQLVDTDFLRRTFPNWSMWGWQPLVADPGRPVDVDIVCGACIMVKRSVFEQVGMLATDYLMYGDEMDLCYRIKKAGHKVFYTGQVHVIHHGGKSTASWKQNLTDVWVRDSIFKFLAKTRGKWYGVLHKFTIVVVAGIRLALISSTTILTNDALRRKQQALAFMKWKRILQWALGFDHWAKSAGEEIGFARNEW